MLAPMRHFGPGFYIIHVLDCLRRTMLMINSFTYGTDIIIGNMFIDIIQNMGRFIIRSSKKCLFSPCEKQIVLCAKCAKWIAKSIEWCPTYFSNIHQYGSPILTITCHLGFVHTPSHFKIRCNIPSGRLRASMGLPVKTRFVIPYYIHVSW